MQMNAIPLRLRSRSDLAGRPRTTNSRILAHKSAICHAHLARKSIVELASVGVILTLSSGLILPVPAEAATASPFLPEALFREAENLISLIRERLGQSFPSLSTSPDPKIKADADASFAEFSKLNSSLSLDELKSKVVEVEKKILEEEAFDETEKEELARRENEVKASLDSEAEVVEIEQQIEKDEVLIEEEKEEVSRLEETLKLIMGSEPFSDEAKSEEEQESDPASQRSSESDDSHSTEGAAETTESPRAPEESSSEAPSEASDSRSLPEEESNDGSLSSNDE